MVDGRRAPPPRGERSGVERIGAGSRSSSAHDTRGSLASGGTFARRFRIERFISRGGMGSVYEVVDLEPAGSGSGGARSSRAFSSRLALKVMTKIEDDPVAVERFRREAELARSLVGPQFPRVMVYGVEHDAPYIVMELLEGETLAARLKQFGTLTPRACEDLVNQLAGGLELAHAIGIVHRDITPRNLYFAAAPGDPSKPEVLKILDFGIAKHASSNALTVPGTIVGSPYYVSPEQTRGSDTIDGRTDLWSVAVVLYEALVGRRPFEGEPLEALMKILKEEPTPPTVLRPNLGAAVDAFFLRALAKSPEARFETATELAEAFSEALRDLPVDVLDTRSSGKPRPATLERSEPRVIVPDPEDEAKTAYFHTPPSRPADRESVSGARPRMDALLDVLQATREAEGTLDDAPAPIARPNVPASTPQPMVAPAPVRVPSSRSIRPIEPAPLGPRAWIALGVGLAIGMIVAFVYLRS